MAFLQKLVCFQHTWFFNVNQPRRIYVVKKRKNTVKFSWIFLVPGTYLRVGTYLFCMWFWYKYFWCGSGTSIFGLVPIRVFLVWFWYEYFWCGFRNEYFLCGYDTSIFGVVPEKDLIFWCIVIATESQFLWPVKAYFCDNYLQKSIALSYRFV